MKRLCLEYEIEPLTLTLLAKILKRSGLKDCQPTAGRLMIAASRLHDPGATLSLVHEAIRTSKLSHPDMIGPRTHLEILVKNDKDPAAMILLAQIREVQGRTDEALRLYEGAANANSDTYTGFEAVEYDIGESWAKVSRLRLGKGDLEGARAAIEKAAFEYDKPIAYYYLATDHQTQDPADYLRYLLKAAASGVIPAAQCLGMYYDMQWKQNVGISPGGKASIEGKVEVGSLSPKKHSSMSKEESEMNWLLATEWFTVAAEAGHHRSRISLAIILRSGESVQEGMDWLNREAFPANWTNGVAALKDNWWDHEIDMKWVDVDELQNWKP
ncbi:Tetratricopeptide-like helical domain [Lasallia pustulata]|uniref:Tetratricopeptide-like helical domain n=1 Tax=Lasallia pustulata TaxID=136370 RepID=A0A1W5D8M5_9LECA|nr:Tetratricopeptide-like helical domain [Lasallia pustulata]